MRVDSQTAHKLLSQQPGIMRCKAHKLNQGVQLLKSKS
jgi:hypothetical protein